MPLPNRVAPDGALFATAARGLLMGNRGGRFHDPQTRALPRRIQASRQWICCVLSFKNRRRQVWSSGYTELFFCDEVTALAAGHRPCMECRRADALAYRAALVRGLGLRETPLFPAIDRLLDGARRDGRAQRTHRLPGEMLPDAAVIRDGDRFLALHGDAALPWTPEGYGTRGTRPTGMVTVLTPPASLAALAQGYRPLWHPSAHAAS
ncbi:MAG: hypothetical protein Q8S58_06875 [Bosea sp. (in: a-proteobacteria)]|uniref:hypothetical protein n=1 Tax=Bosea sp. (in: a-proteobacteria) TaxID=1871050 RepID=UPI0027323D5C|nr:hypothetical protein [Bosea sp. (in: a-proteobacteria)]MDP3255782.1 hypothetical protein [Bosea sp. (in: a-proteobacteria)]MDP3318835.1 hypothetical protein [Bosea sp. (in: a-proteobacteria)]